MRSRNSSFLEIRGVCSSSSSNTRCDNRQSISPGVPARESFQDLLLRLQESIVFSISALCMTVTIRRCLSTGANAETTAQPACESNYARTQREWQQAVSVIAVAGCNDVLGKLVITDNVYLPCSCS